MKATVEVKVNSKRGCPFHDISFNGLDACIRVMRYPKYKCWWWMNIDTDEKSLDQWGKPCPPLKTKEAAVKHALTFYGIEVEE